MFAKVISSARRLGLLILGLPLLAAGGALSPAPAAALAPTSCERLHVTYSQLDVGVAYPATVSSSSCSVGAGLPANSNGSGSVTNDGFGGPIACAAFDACDHFDLTINVGPATIHPVFEAAFDASGTGSLVVVRTSLSEVAAGSIIAFQSGTGSGALASTCIYDPVAGVDNCTADGSFTWTG